MASIQAYKLYGQDDKIVWEEPGTSTPIELDIYGIYSYATKLLLVTMLPLSFVSTKT